MIEDDAPPPSSPGDKEPDGPEEPDAAEARTASPSDVKAAGALVAGKYRVVRLLGRGGMGAVYEVEHIGVKRRFALKVMSRDVSEQKDAVRRFTQEAQAAARIGSPNIVDVFDLGEDADGSLYMVMELLRGETLYEHIDEKMPVRRAVALTIDLLSALAAAHEHGIVHRDVKPQNLFLAKKTGSDEPVLKVLDFGIAKFREQEDGTVSDHTKSGVVVGTPLYMAPEQVMGEKEIDGRVDVWAAAATLFEMLTGRSVHLAPNATAAAVRVVTEKAPRVDALRKDVDRALADIVERALAIERDARFPTANDMKRALEDYLAGPAPGSTKAVAADGDAAAPETMKTRRSEPRSPMWLIAVGAFALGVGVVAVLANGKPSSTSTSTSISTTTSPSPSPSPSTSTTTTTTTTTSPSLSTSASTLPSPSSPSLPDASAPPPAPSGRRAPPVPSARKPECAQGQSMSDGHCCPAGHVWEGSRCARPVATSFP